MSNLITHARRELELLGEDEETIKGYLTMIAAFSEMGHSGGSASVFIPTISRLLWHKNLTPLTNDPAEWIHHDESTWGEPGGIWQNNRDSSAFSKDGGKSYYLQSDKDWPRNHSLYVSADPPLKKPKD